MINDCDRRRFLKAALAGSAAIAFGEASGLPAPSAAMRRASAALPLEHELIRLACRAANSHNAQAWRFHAAAGWLSIRADRSRRCPVVDPNDHHLWVSLGCAVENIVQAAPGLGRRAEVSLVAGDPPELTIALVETGSSAPTALAAAITSRQSTRSEYDGRRVPPLHLEQLVEAARGHGVSACQVTDQAVRSRLESLILAANAEQIEANAYRRELKAWLRFNEADARRLGDGLFSACSGNPQVPAWLGNRLFDWFYDATSANETLARQLASSSGLILVHSARNDRAQWIEVGRATQRLALQITALGMKMAFVNPPLEVESFRPRVLSTLGLNGRHADLLLRFGYAKAMPTSFRRPLHAVLD